MKHLLSSFTHYPGHKYYGMYGNLSVPWYNLITKQLRVVLKIFARVYINNTFILQIFVKVYLKERKVYGDNEILMK